jgi:predicted ATP-grasp superfamily ATP-dependent carboligase
MKKYKDNDLITKEEFDDLLESYELLIKYAHEALKEYIEDYKDLENTYNTFKNNLRFIRFEKIDENEIIFKIHMPIEYLETPVSMKSLEISTPTKYLYDLEYRKDHRRTIQSIKRIGNLNKKAKQGKLNHELTKKRLLEG